MNRIRRLWYRYGGGKQADDFLAARAAETHEEKLARYGDEAFRAFVSIPPITVAAIMFGVLSPIMLEQDRLFIAAVMGLMSIGAGLLAVARLLTGWHKLQDQTLLAIAHDMASIAETNEQRTKEIHKHLMIQTDYMRQIVQGEPTSWMVSPNDDE